MDLTLKKMKLSSYLDPKFVMINLKGDTIQEVISGMIDIMSKESKEIRSKKEMIEEIVLKREEELSTAIGGGIAIPHGRIKDFEDFIIGIAVLSTPFEIDMIGSKKKEKIEFVVLILSDILKNKSMLKTMSAISKLSMKKSEIFDKLKKSETAMELIQLVKESNVEIEQNITAMDLLENSLLPIKVTTTLEVVAQRLISELTTGLPVVDEEGIFLGEVTERELIEYGMPKYTHGLEDLDFLMIGEPFEEYLLNEKIVTIENLYRREGVFTVDTETSIMAICSIIMKKGATRIYVLGNGKYIGIIRRSDIIKKVLHL